MRAAEQTVLCGVVSMGNPHCVIQVDDVQTAAVETLGPVLESHERFPERANIGFMQVVKREHIRLRVYERGAGEILLTSMDKDGTKSGFDLKLTKAVVEVVGIPVIASGGCGSLEHFSEVFEKTGCDAALAASLFHYRELTVGEVKEHLKEKGIPVRK